MRVTKCNTYKRACPLYTYVDSYEEKLATVLEKNPRRKRKIMKLRELHANMKQLA